MDYMHILGYVLVYSKPSSAFSVLRYVNLLVVFVPNITIYGAAYNLCFVTKSLKLVYFPGPMRSRRKGGLGIRGYATKYSGSYPRRTY